MQVGAAMELLRPLLADITVDGLSLVGEVTVEELDLTEDDAVFPSPLAVSLDLTNIEGTGRRNRCVGRHDCPRMCAVFEGV